MLARLVSYQPVGPGEQGEDQPADGRQFEEASTGVLGVGKSRGGRDQLGASEQVAELDRDEHQEQEIDEAEGRRDRDDAERQLRVTVGERARRRRAE